MRERRRRRSGRGRAGRPPRSGGSGRAPGRARRRSLAAPPSAPTDTISASLPAVAQARPARRSRPASRGSRAPPAAMHALVAEGLPLCVGHDSSSCCCRSSRQSAPAGLPRSPPSSAAPSSGSPTGRAVEAGDLDERGAVVLPARAHPQPARAHEERAQQAEQRRRRRPTSATSVPGLRLIWILFQRCEAVERHRAEAVGQRHGLAGAQVHPERLAVGLRQLRGLGLVEDVDRRAGAVVEADVAGADAAARRAGRARRRRPTPAS